jgi:hypothetical protein
LLFNEFFFRRINTEAKVLRCLFFSTEEGVAILFPITPMPNGGVCNFLGVSTNSTTAAETLSSRSPLIRAATPSPSLSNSKEVYEPDHNHSVQSTTALQVVFTNSKDFLSPGRSVMFLDPTTGNDKDNGSLQCPRPSHLP